jgi:hypothetical protein
MTEGQVVHSTNHGEVFEKLSTERAADGSQVLITWYWKATCGCAVEIIMLPPREAEAN